MNYISRRSFNSMRCLPLEYVPRYPVTTTLETRARLNNWHDISFIMPQQVDKCLGDNTPYLKLRLKRDQYTMVMGMVTNNDEITATDLSKAMIPADQFLTVPVGTPLDECEEFMNAHKSSHLFVVDEDKETVQSLITVSPEGDALIFQQIA